MTKFIILLIRKKLALNKNQYFKFNNQADQKNVYFFTSDSLMKKYVSGYTREANVSLNYLLSDDCMITKLNQYA